MSRRDKNLSPTDPRAVAIEAALAASRSEGGASIEDALRARQSKLSARDRSLAREIVSGSTRRRASLDAVLSCFARKPGSPRFRETLRQAVYQLIYLDRIPDHAATHSAVELVKRHEPRAAGAANAILRAVLRARQETDQEDPDGLVVSASRAVKIAGLAAPDPATDEAGNLSVRFSFPRDLIAGWISECGRARTLERLHVANTSPPLALWFNPRAGDRAQVLARLSAAGIAASAGVHERSIIIDEGIDPQELPGHSAGDLVVQGEAAQRACMMLDARGARLMLDLCAAPGGKAAHVAALAIGGNSAVNSPVNSSAGFVLVDSDATRLAMALPLFQKLGLPAPQTITADARAFRLPDGLQADRVLVDAPCSNSGVLARRVEARWRFSTAGLAALAKTQCELLDAGLKQLAPGGRLVYSTCSLEPTENQNVVAAVLSRRGDITRVLEQTLEPADHHGDGGFIAVLTRNC